MLGIGTSIAKFSWARMDLQSSVGAHEKILREY